MDRAFDAALRYAQSEAVDWETAGACLMGCEVAAMIRPQTYGQLLPILARLGDADGLALEPLLRLGVVLDEKDELARRAGLQALFAAFRTCLAACFADRHPPGRA